jgi:hypothetical protein
MSLRAFHLFFIAVSATLAVFVAAWAATQYQSAHEVVYPIGGVVSLASGGGLVAYATAFQRKTRRPIGL